MARRFNRDRVLAAQVAAAVERGASPAELVETAGGRLDVLEHALAVAERGSEMRAPVLEHGERLRAAVGAGVRWLGAELTGRVSVS